MLGDAAGNVYVTGRSFDNAGDYLTLKYNSAGVLQWARTYNSASGGLAIDQSNAIALDPSGNVVVTGYSYGGTATDADFCTVKYSSNGDSLWVRRHNGYPSTTNIDVATALICDDSGNVYVTGYGPGPASLVDVFTIKYSPNGDSLWGKYYNFPATNGGDRGWAITRDNLGNIIVVGESWGGTQIPPATGDDILILKYTSGGTLLQVRRIVASAGPNADSGRDVVTDGGGNIYVTGFSLQGGPTRFTTVKTSPNTDSLWQRNLTGAEQGRKIALDKSGNIIATGDAFGPDYATVKYSSTGTQLWSATYNNGGSDQAMDVAVDTSNNVYVTGWSAGTFDGDFATVKYDSAGTQKWVKRYNSGVGGDVAIAIHVFSPGQFAVAGYSLGSGEIVTIRYAESLVPVNEVSGELPAEISLLQNYPNPFNPSTLIRYSIPREAHTTLKVFNILGQEVATLANRVMQSGKYEARLDATSLPSGVYFYALSSGGRTETKKMLLTK
jgi:hypothetical protein